jgi:glutamine synthetase
VAVTPKEVLALAAEKGVKIVDLRFVDVPGTWQHFSIPVRKLEEDMFSEGIGFDGSSIRGFQQIHESDMLLMPDADAATIDPFAENPTLNIVCNVAEPGTLNKYSRDPRHIAQKAEAFLQSTGIADVSYWGPEAEFFVFDEVRYQSAPNIQYYEIDSMEAHWNSAREEMPNLGYKIRTKEGYFPVPPADSLQDLRSEMVLLMEEAGIEVEAHHHEVATAGQSEIDMRFGPLVKMADQMMMYKYIVKNVAKKHGKTATFMPKPIFGDNGSGMHTHQSLWKDGNPLFSDKSGYAGLSETALYYIGGLLTHAPAILAFAAPLVNSYKRLVPGYEAPVNLVFSRRNRSAAVRIPVYSESPKQKRVEFRPPDPGANPYLAFAAMLLAGIDGIRRKIDPRGPFGPVDENIYELPERRAARIKSVPGSLSESLSAIWADRRFLLENGVFTEDLLTTYINYKTDVEIDEFRLRPTPYEYFLYYDV